MSIDPENLPAGPFQITDDTEARAFLQRLDILHKLVPPSSLPDCWSTVAVHSKGDYHYVILWYDGYPVAAENGITVQAWPARYCTRESVLAAMKKSLSKGTSETDPWRIIE
jgi:hypothetical protein